MSSDAAHKPGTVSVSSRETGTCVEKNPHFHFKKSCLSDDIKVRESYNIWYIVAGPLAVAEVLLGGATGHVLYGPL